jgi:plasmid stability protein
MADILVRNLDAKTLQRLKARAKQHGRSLQNEAKLLLEQAAGTGNREITAMLKGWRKRFSGRRYSSSVAMIREDRRR